jgi:Domain of unknown function (DUF4270)
MFQKNYAFPLWVFTLVILLAHGCQDPILVGSDLLEDEKLNLNTVDTFNLKSTTIAGERVVTHRPTVDSRNYMLGQLNDPIYGKTTSELILKFMMGSAKANYHTEVGIKFDSLILTMQYDSSVTYGRPNSTQKIEIFQLNNVYSERDTFYSDINMPVSSRSIAETTAFINPLDSVTIIDHVTRNTVRLAPHLRVRLSEGFGRALIGNEDAAKNDTLFNTYMKGFKISSSAVNSESFIYGFNFSNSVLTASGPMNKLIMYYTVASGDTSLRKTYEYTINTATINKFIHDAAGSKLQSTLTNTSLSNTETFLIPMGGAKTILSLEDVKKISGRLINKAELEVYVADPSGKDGYNSPPPQLTAAYKLSSGSLALVPDIAQLVSNNVDFSAVFGGNLNTSNQVFKYTMNVTNFVKSILKDNNQSSDIYLGILTESEIARRVLLYGAKHPLYPMKLKITYTEN